ncbi:MAG: SO2930 family diheme c-type cytochrome [Saprospiraceae bacterium]|nr:SO2930 family diheme c-type cytochrome [Saprospiraceae bacterium]
MKTFLGLALIATSMLLSQCQKKNYGVVIMQGPHDMLSEYNFFGGHLGDLQPINDVLPYDLNSPLFSDYAHKARFVWMPEGTSAQYTTDHVLKFPEGTALIKNFYYENDETDLTKGRNIVETRVLINRGEEWDAYGYIWNEEQTEATFEVIGDIQEISWINKEGQKQDVDYIIPNKNQCKSCHAYKNKQLPIGPKVRNLNKDFDYVDGKMNQLKKWAETGYLSGWTEGTNAPRVAVWDDENEGIHDRSMAYLDINCGHCHNPDGAANTSGLTLLADSELNSKLGIYKATVSAGAGTGGFTYSIVPGNPEESILVYRMKSDNPGAMMPELGRRLLHTEGVSLIEEWIRDMDVAVVSGLESALD